MGAGIKPGETALESLDIELSPGQELLIHRCYLQLSPC